MHGQGGWQLIGHELFARQMQKLAARVDAARIADPLGWQTDPNTRCAAAIRALTLRVIPSNPLPPHHQCAALADNAQRGISDHARWGRAEFGAGRFALFYRVQPRDLSIVYVWVSDRQASRPQAASEPHVLWQQTSRITSAGRILVPLHVRQALCAAEGDLLAYRLVRGGAAVVSRLSEGDEHVTRARAQGAGNGRQTRAPSPRTFAAPLPATEGSERSRTPLPRVAGEGEARRAKHACA